MKLENGFKKIVDGVPKELVAAANCLKRACHKVAFYKTESDVFYAAGELAAAVMADLYLRYEKRVTPAFDKKPEKVNVTITCYGNLWLPMLGKPQLCVYERKIDTDPSIVIAECWANILGASSMFPLIDSGNAFNREMAKTIVAESESIIPSKVFKKLTEKYSMDELPGMPPTPKTDVLASFVTFTNSYVLPRIANAHKSFYYSLFKTKEAIVTITQEPELIADEPVKGPPVNYDKPLRDNTPDEELPVEEATKTAPLDEPVEPPKPALGPPKPRVANPSAATQSIEQRIAFKFPELAKFSENLIKNWRVQNPEITDAEIWTCWTKWVEGRERYLASQKDVPGLKKTETGASPISSGSESVPVSKPAVSGLGLPKAKRAVSS